MVRVLIVCTGNICRSPTAEGVMRELARKRGLAGRVKIESAGTHDYHVGEAPDPRTQEHAESRKSRCRWTAVRGIRPSYARRSRS